MRRLFFCMPFLCWLLLLQRGKRNWSTTENGNGKRVPSSSASFFFFFLSLLYDFLAFGERSVCIRIESARLRKWTRRGGCLPIQHSCACMRFHVTIIVITGYECDIQDKNCCNIHKMADETAEMNGRLRLFANLSVMRSFHYEYEQRRGTMRPMKVTGS